MDKITKLPWKATRNPFDVNDFHVYIIEKDLSIADGKIALVENITDAEYICRAVNSHEGLVEAAKEAQRTYEYILDGVILDSEKGITALKNKVRIENLKLKEALKKAADGE